MKSFNILMVVALSTLALSAQARGTRRNCIPLPNVSTPVTQVPQDPSAYCDPPWTNPQTVWITCEPKLTRVNAYSLCHFECGPSHDTGSASGLCEQACYARMCQYGR